jgi:hypothetical protein
MPLTAFTVLVLVALVLTLIAGISGRVPLWIGVLLLCVALLIGR